MLNWLVALTNKLPLIRVLSPDLHISIADADAAERGNARAQLRILEVITRRVERKVTKDVKVRFAQRGVELQDWFFRKARGALRQDEAKDVREWILQWAAGMDQFRRDREKEYLQQELDAWQQIAKAPQSSL